ncbi:MAG: DUF72 domain-containing protein [Planctomycetota bacterium]|nr:DUF72 domain-containing protein [Planctomycetota bacterium]
MDSKKYYIGCPVWSCDRWRGKVFPVGTKRKDRLNLYSKQFSTVEGNTTFYALPTVATVQKWVGETAEGFRFALKFPRVISHDCRLVDCDPEIDHFLDCLQILKDAKKLGPAFLQLPPDFGFAEFHSLKRFVSQLPADFPFAVETRHPDYFEEPNQVELSELLAGAGIDRVIFDSRPLFAHPPADLTESEARIRKPRLPICRQVTGPHPFLRFVGINCVDKLTGWIDQWAPIVADWINQEKQPFVFLHTPDEEFAPDFARRFHTVLQRKVAGLGDLPQAPDFQEDQLRLF